ncbi:MAG: 2-hydroxychromene-2-carboxylate isomerase [Ramlibacter sp.]
MKHITFWLDFISPYAFLAFEQLPQALQGLSWRVDYKPVLFAGLLKQHGQLGPAEIAPKRDWTYRQVLWQAHTHGIPLQLPAAHPFNPLALLRLALACSSDAARQAAPGTISRHVAETIFRHVWRGGADATDAVRLEALKQALNPSREPSCEAVKGELKTNTEEAVARGLFGVPTMAVDDKLFWGLDALPMLRAYLEGDAWFAGNDWDSVRAVASGVTRVAKG